MYPVSYEARYTENQDRVRTFFRPLLALPWLIIGSVYTTAASIVALIAWFGILFTGRYPRGLYDFNAGALMFLGRSNAFQQLQTDKWPPFGIGPERRYPVRTTVGPPQESYNRWKTGFRFIVGIPVAFMLALMGALYGAAAIAAWFHIVFTGHTSGGIHNALTTGLAYQQRATAYFLLMTETYPPVSDQAPAESLVPPGKPARRKALKAGATRKSTPRKTSGARKASGARKTTSSRRSTGTRRGSGARKKSSS